MKKLLLFAAGAALALTAAAETQTYWFEYYDAEFDKMIPQMGTVTSVSPNGEYAIILDDEMRQSFLWKKSDPENLQLLNWKSDDNYEVPLELYAVNSSGTIAGSYLPYGSYAYKPFYQELGGEVIDLPVPVWVSNLNYPVAISEDGNIIGGYLGGDIESKTTTNPETGEPEVWGGHWPVIWAKGADGEFECHVNHDQSQMPDHQGFYVNSMYTDGTLDGTWLGGQLYCGAGASIPAVYNQGQIIKWNELTYIELPDYYKGEIIGYSKYEVIDGKIDLHYATDDVIEAGIYSVDHDGNFFGTRYNVGELMYDPDAAEPDPDNYGRTQGDTYSWGYFNVNSGEWTEADGNVGVSCALTKDVFFSGRNVYTNGINGGTKNIADEYGIDTNGVNWNGVTKASQDGHVLGMLYTMIDSTGKSSLYPFIAVLDKSIVGVDDIIIDGEAKQLILVYGGTIEVTGAKEVAVYDINGVQVSDKAISNVGAGTYVVVADGNSHKILVK